MGKSGAAIISDLGALGYNPAGIYGIPALSALFMHDNLYMDTGVYYAAAGFPIGNTIFALSYLWYDGGEFTVDYTDDPGLHGTQVTALSDHIITIAAARSLNDKSIGGVSLRYLSSELIEEYSYQTFTADVGVVYMTGFLETGLERILVRPWSPGMRFGLSVKNIFGEAGYISDKEPLERKFRLGASHKIRFNHNDTIVSALDLLYSLRDGLHPSIGIEYNYRNMLMFRTGFVLREGVNRLSFGIGLGYSGLRADYGILPVSAMEHRHLFMFSFVL